ncbi:TRAP transporter substrate-binding protein [Pseudomonas syringae]|uniref:TRAP transporter substrate-binding protein n=1 Tax=Pseudomonas syringae TaxID=317 RepID=UPI001F311BB1|nr:TRAP transporter substrate-binding protein [Pseudomonas syringae]MBL3832394.1 TRAP transporter substrate-binding protein [Pseudomonas syringae pv. theae]MBL3836736.1 TRAP transporter substrate-binding protein [Pseudomonas syringae pv. theae]MBL3868591.1 TRAP transporter substrate-binding protein [Pseudomonas syringae pv. theae]GKQ48318.1 TRAP transporter substrate-binding protein [Pseudomonas syringae pv. theae]
MLKFVSRKNVVLNALAGLVLLVGTDVAMAEQTLRLAHASSSSSLINQAMTRFAAQVSAQTNGELKVQLYPDGQLGDEAPIVDSVGAGAIDIGLGGSTDGIDPRLNALSLPFLFEDSVAVHAYLDSEAGKKFLSMGQDHGFVILSALDSGFRQFANSKHPVLQPADLNGLKIRTPPNPVILATIKQLGGLGQSIPFGEVYTSLQSGVVDGVEPELRDFYDQKWYEVAKYVSLSNYVWSANFWFINKYKYESLSETERSAIDQAVISTTAWYRAQLEAVYSKIQQEMQAKGVKFNDVNPRPFRELSNPVYAQFGKVWGEAFVSQLRRDAQGE